MNVHVFLLVFMLFFSLALLCALSCPHLGPAPSRTTGKLRSRLPRLLKPRSPDDCPACRLASAPSLGAGTADVASLVRGEKPARSTQAREYGGLCLSQPPVPVLLHHR